jgi:hypothetical protein
MQDIQSVHISSLHCFSITYAAEHTNIQSTPMQDTNARFLQSNQDLRTPPDYYITKTVQIPIGEAGRRTGEDCSVLTFCAAGDGGLRGVPAEEEQRMETRARPVEEQHEMETRAHSAEQGAGDCALLGG